MNCAGLCCIDLVNLGNTFPRIPFSVWFPVRANQGTCLRSGRQKGNSVHYSQKESCWINGDGQAWESQGGYSFSQLYSTLPPALLPIGWPYGPTAVLGLLPDA